MFKIDRYYSNINVLNLKLYVNYTLSYLHSRQKK